MLTLVLSLCRVEAQQGLLLLWQYGIQGQMQLKNMPKALPDEATAVTCGLADLNSANATAES